MEHHSDFNPYVNNGGTVVAAVWNNCAVIAADTRLSIGYAIHTRNVSKLKKLTQTCVIGTSGMQADMHALHSALERQIELYRFKHHREPGISVIAQLLSTILYSRRFFPYYTFNILCGVDENGRGITCGFDAIGNYGFDAYMAKGTSSSLIMSILDNHLTSRNQQKHNEIQSLEELINVIKGAMTSAVERDIFTGDAAEVIVIDSMVHDPIRMPMRVD
ncbi:Proteasome subunit beta type-1 family protein [Babesia bovis T2Bo]|uniref:Proteasome A-type and B-type family protein n=1 Tax=Babesia bovis TaxID=5865 RepID=A7ATG6_BABBO|nr:Proteasome subunit beta type-1 family protein [Babesia bovis T2Bo]EDO06227.1 Proteasome subunit beta type-1 family protein [Babesia bovis T2Bo]|eukprot:XP_001609795.1 proteasome A-type and B-type family protein [Babesia bovis T2Bo]